MPMTTFSGTDVSVYAYYNLDNARKRLNDQRKKDQEELRSSLNIYGNIINKTRLQSESSIGGFPSIGTDGTGLLTQEQSALGRGEYSAGADYISDIDGNKNKESFQENVYNLGNLHTFSYSSFREKNAVRTLGRSHSKAYTRGARTVAGSMVFNTIEESQLFQFIRLFGNDAAMKSSSKEATSHAQAMMSHLDQLKPFNLALVFANEYGQYSVMHVINVDINTEGQEISVDRPVLYNSVNYYAETVLPLVNIGGTFSSQAEMLEGLAKSIKNVKEKSSRYTDSTTRASRLEASTELLDKNLVQKYLQNSRGLY